MLYSKNAEVVNASWLYTFSWYSVAGATSYNIEGYTALNPGQIPSITDSTSLTYYSTNTVGFYRVQATNGAIKSGWSIFYPVGLAAGEAKQISANTVPVPVDVSGSIKIDNASGTVTINPKENTQENTGYVTISDGMITIGDTTIKNTTNDKGFITIDNNSKMVTTNPSSVPQSLNKTRPIIL